MKQQTTLIALAAAALMSAAPLAIAGGNHGHGSHGHQSEQGERTAEGVGEIRAIAEDRSSITLEHAPIRELRWPAMTMELALASPGLAESLEVGKQVRFQLRQTGATDYEIIRIDAHQ